MTSGLAALTIAVAFPSALRAAELVTNGGFEAANFIGWTATTNSFLLVTGPHDGVSPFAGSFFASNGCTEPTSPCDISQTLSTKAGTTYHLSFAFNPGSGVDGTTEGDTKVFWDGSLVIDLLGGAIGYTPHGFDLLASSASTALLFSGFQIPAFSGLDNVSVNSVGAVPLPAALPLFASGLGVMGWVARRKKRKAAELNPN
jgi:hypothetical protein